MKPVEMKTDARPLAPEPKVSKTVGFLRRHTKECIILGMLLLILALPFVLRSAIQTPIPTKGERLVIITPHNETIRWEFGEAFSRYMKEAHDKDVIVDWRNPGGTSEIAKVLNSEYVAAFENYWKTKKLGEWAPVAKEFNNRKLSPAKEGETETSAQRGRRLFLDSHDVGIGMDLFFGGGAYDFITQAGAGHLVATDESGQYGLRSLKAQHPDWFDDAIMPEELSGEPFRDDDDRWAGACLSSFGMCFNKDGLERLGIENHPDQWADLADPRLIGEIALADPAKSGSATKAFEMLIQQQMQQAMETEIFRASQIDDERSDEEIEEDAIRKGWTNGLRLIQRISANARYFTDSSSKIPLDVAQGNAVAGMCIDFYGRTFAEITRREAEQRGEVADDGSGRVLYVTPRGGSSVGVDPIGMLRGAPRPDLAHAFLEFVFTPEGQRLWNYRAGTEGGPRQISLRRLPIRRDSYTSADLANFADPSVLPYETADSFQYRGEWTGRAFNSIRFIIRLACVDTHDELQEAWEAIIEAGMPRDAIEVFENVEMVNYDIATNEIGPVLSSRAKLSEVRLARDLADDFRHQYRTAADVARRHQRAKESAAAAAVIEPSETP